MVEVGSGDRDAWDAASVWIMASVCSGFVGCVIIT